MSENVADSNQIEGLNYIYLIGLFLALTLTQILIVPYIILLGYMGRIIQNDKLPLSFDRVNQLFSEGMRIFTVLLIYFVAPISILLSISVVVSVRSNLDTTMTVAIVSLLLCLGLLYILPAVILRVSAKNTIDEVLHLGKIIETSLSTDYLFKHIQFSIFTACFCGIFVLVYVQEWFTQVYLLLCLNSIVLLICGHIFKGTEIVD